MVLRTLFILSVLSLVLACERIPEWEKVSEPGSSEDGALQGLSPSLWTCRGIQTQFGGADDSEWMGSRVDRYLDYFRTSGLSTVQSGSLKTIMGPAFLWDSQGHVVTLLHWVNQGKDFECRGLATQWISARIVGVDRALNLALMKLDEAEGLARHRWLARESYPNVGEQLYVLGQSYPGQVDRIRVEAQPVRPVLLTDVDQSLILYLPSSPSVLQGGVLSDSEGRVLGLSFLPEPSIWGTAISVKSLKEVVSRLIRHGRVERAFLGMRLQFEPGQGFLVQEVDLAGPAYRAGLRVGDFVRSWDSVSLGRLEDWPKFDFDSVGRRVLVTYERDSKVREARLQISAAQ